MEDIDFKIPMTRDKLVELGQYPTIYRRIYSTGICFVMFHRFFKLHLFWK